MPFALLSLDSGVHDLLLSCLSTKDLFTLQKVSNDFRACVTGYNRRAYRIEKVLEPYFTSEQVGAFRAVQHETGALISGSAALQFFDRSFYPEGDLDIYVEHVNALKVAQFLLEVGYQCITSDPQRETVVVDVAQELNKIRLSDLQDDYEFPGISGLMNFLKDDRLIQLVTTVYHSTLFVILSFHSTVVMNFISHSAAYSLYPKATFLERIGCTIGRSDHMNPGRVAAIDKYRVRGWSFPHVSMTASRHQRNPDFLFNEAFRYVGDPSCWTIPLPTLDSIHSLQDDPDPVLLNSWDLIHNYTDNADPCMFSQLEVIRIRGSAQCLFTVSSSLLGARPTQRLSVSRKDLSQSEWITTIQREYSNWTLPGPVVYTDEYEFW